MYLFLNLLFFDEDCILYNVKAAPHTGLKLSPHNPARPGRHYSESDKKAGVNEAYGGCPLIACKDNKKITPLRYERCDYYMNNI